MKAAVESAPTMESTPVMESTPAMRVGPHFHSVWLPEMFDLDGRLGVPSKAGAGQTFATGQLNRRRLRALGR